MTKRKRIIKKLILLLIIVFLLMNVVTIFHAYKFTHFAVDIKAKTNSPEKLNSFEKFKTLILGVSNPRPTNTSIPNSYLTVELESNKKIECWYLNKDNSVKTDTVKGTIIIFHGYSGCKSSMIDRSNEFDVLKYNCFLVDFMGSGGSEGNQTTLGYKEAEEVKAAYEYLINRGEKDIYLYGTSMGAVAILKAINDYNLRPKGIIIECPFGSMYQTTCARFKNMNLPAFPLAGLLVFWGGIQNGFWAFSHNPTEYAKKVICPTLLLYGEQDKNVSRKETDEIFANIKGRKTLRTYKFAGHENYLIKYKNEWLKDVTEFLNAN